MTKQHLPHPEAQTVTLRSWITFVALAIVWGSSFILMKRGLLAYTPTQVGMLRITFAAAFILGISFKKLKALRRENVWPLLVVGIVSIVFPYLLFPLAVSKLDSGVVGILNSLVPLFTLIIGVIWFQTKVSRIAVVGIVLGFLGAVWLLLPGLEIDSTKLIYGSFPIIAGVGYAIGVNTVNRYLRDLEPMEVTVISLAFAVVPALVMIWYTDVVVAFQASEYGLSSLGYIAIMGVAGTALANYFFNNLIKETGSLFSSSVTYAIPVVALMWGFWDGEPVGVNEVLGMVLILLGVWLVNSQNRSSKRAAAAIMDVEMAPEVEIVSEVGIAKVGGSQVVDPKVLGSKNDKSSDSLK